MFRNKKIALNEFRLLLKEAISHADVATVKDLLDEAMANQYDINDNDPKTQYTPLHFAIAKTTNANMVAMLDIMNALYDAGSDINKRATDSLSNTPIHTACRRALPVIVAWLIERDVNVNVRDTKNKTPLEYVELAISRISHDRINHQLNDIQSLLKPVTKTHSSHVKKYGIFALTVICAVAVATDIYLNSHDTNQKTQP